jgi:sugar lactone lactonase YvrE
MLDDDVSQRSAEPGALRLRTDEAVYAESPRWHEGALYFSDVHDYRVKRLGEDGELSVVAEVPQRPAGIGFLPDGRLLVASAFDRTVSLVVDGGLKPVADLSGMTTGFLNDMVVTGDGTAYVGATGFNLMAGEPPRPGQLVRLRLDEAPAVVSDEVLFPNGVAVTAAGDRLLLAETAGRRISVFDVAADGSLGPRRLFATLETGPDGLCLDSDGGVWTALLTGNAFVRLDRDGRITERIGTIDRLAVACVFGGDRRDQLFLCSADTTMERLARGVSRGLIHSVVRRPPGAGWP